MRAYAPAFPRMSILGSSVNGDYGGGSRYSTRYPKNSSSLTTFLCLINTVRRCRRPLPLILASLLYTLLIL
jgi:hypothetical protein